MARDRIHRNCEDRCILSIGTSWYTMLLPELVPCHWTTVDVTARARRLAVTSDRHYTINLADKTQDLYQAKTYDVVIVNGVLGWGVNTLGEATEMLRKLCSYLKPGGLLLIGYNDTPEHCLYDISAAVPEHMTLLNKTLADPAEHSMHTYLQYLLTDLS